MARFSVNDPFLHFIKVQEPLNSLHGDDQIDDFREEKRYLDQWTLHQVEND